MFESVRAKLDDIAGIGGRWEPAARLSDLLARNQAPQVTPAGFILPLGLRGGQVVDASGAYIQKLAETLGIILVVRSAGDATGAKATDALEPLIVAVVTRIVGWVPPSRWRREEAIGQFTLARGELVSLSAGTAIYQLDFALEDQLRIFA